MIVQWPYSTDEQQKENAKEAVIFAFFKQSFERPSGYIMQEPRSVNKHIHYIVTSPADIQGEAKG